MKKSRELYKFQNTYVQYKYYRSKSPFLLIIYLTLTSIGERLLIFNKVLIPPSSNFPSTAFLVCSILPIGILR